MKLSVELKHISFSIETDTLIWWVLGDRFSMPRSILRSTIALTVLNAPEEAWVL